MKVQFYCIPSHAGPKPAINMPCAPRVGDSVEIDPEIGFTVEVVSVIWTPFSREQQHVIVRYR